DDPEVAHRYCNAIDPRTQREFQLPGQMFPFDDGYRVTGYVASYQPNAFGLHAMHGNAWEWCLDTWHDDYSGAPDDGSAWTAGGSRPSAHVLRGGSWGSPPDHCRSATRWV